MQNFLTIFLLFTFPTIAQITIANGDIANAFAVGNGTTIHADTLQSTVDIGTPGGGNNWDFTMFQSNLQISYESVDPASTPHTGDFPGADYATHSIFTAQGITSNIWSYLLLNGTFDNMGQAIEIAIRRTCLWATTAPCSFKARRVFCGTACGFRATMSKFCPAF